MSLARPRFVYDQLSDDRYISRCRYIELVRVGGGRWSWQIHEGELDPFGVDEVAGEAASLTEAKRAAEHAVGDPMHHLMREQCAGPEDIADGQDVTGKRGADLALRGEHRPTMRWAYPTDPSHPFAGMNVEQGMRAITNTAGEAAAKDWLDRFGRNDIRRMPVMYSTDVAANTVRACSGMRLMECGMHYLCTCCGESIDAKADRTGWLFQDAPYDDFGCPGSPLCTRCAYTTLRMCPHFAKMELIGQLRVWRITHFDGYRPSRNMRDNGGIEPVPESGHAHASSADELRSYKRALKRPSGEIAA